MFELIRFLRDFFFVIKKKNYHNVYFCVYFDLGITRTEISARMEAGFIGRPSRLFYANLDPSSVFPTYPPGDRISQTTSPTCYRPVAVCIPHLERGIRNSIILSPTCYPQGDTQEVGDTSAQLCASCIYLVGKM